MCKKHWAVFLSICLTLLPNLRQAVAEQNIKTAIAEVSRHHNLAMDVYELALSLEISGAFSDNPVVYLPTGDRWELNIRHVDELSISASFKFFDANGSLRADAEEFTVTNVDANTYAGDGTISIIGLAPRDSITTQNVFVDATLVGMAEQTAATTVKVGEQPTDAALVDLAKLFQRSGEESVSESRTAPAKVANLSGLAFSRVEFPDQGLRIDPVITPALVGVAGAAAVAAILVIAIVGCFMRWWCMNTLQFIIPPWQIDIQGRPALC